MWLRIIHTLTVTTMLFFSGCGLKTLEHDVFDVEEADSTRRASVDLADRNNHVALSEATALLTDTGLYQDIATFTVSSGIDKFAPQYPLWTDGLKKQRWVKLPQDAVIDANQKDFWNFPAGTKFWKEFAHLDGTSGVLTRVETRYMEKLENGQWAYATFLWNEDQSEAPRAENAGGRRIRNAYPLTEDIFHDVPSHNNCVFCHTTGHDPILGFSAIQLSDQRDPNALHAETVTKDMLNLTTLNRRGKISPPQSTHPVIEARSQIERAALGYLHGNCASCHSPQGRAGNYSIDYMFRLEDQLANRQQAIFGIIYDVNAEAVRQDYKIPGTQWPQINYAVVPGRADLSQMVHRMKARGEAHQMPKIGSALVDDQAVALISAWINELAPSQDHLDILADDNARTRYEEPRRR